MKQVQVRQSKQDLRVCLCRHSASLHRWWSNTEHRMKYDRCTVNECKCDGLWLPAQPRLIVVSA